MTRLATAIVLCLLAGCDDAPDAALASLPAPAFGDAAVAGRVTFVGAPPERRMLDTSACHAGARPHQEETIVVAPGGGLAGAIVYVKDAPASSGSASAEVTLDQVECRFVPHVLAVQVGQTVRFKTSDPVPHNVHWTSASNGDVNFGLFRAGEARAMTFATPEFLALRCDVHPWMSANVGVMSSPFFAVTGVDGRFAIDRLPAGRWTLAAWHPILGERTATIDVAAGGSAEASFAYAPP